MADYLNEEQTEWVYSYFADLPVSAPQEQVEEMLKITPLVYVMCTDVHPEGITDENGEEVSFSGVSVTFTAGNLVRTQQELGIPAWP